MDSICINQVDPAAKSAEIMDMSLIYSNAKQVIVWLGNSSQDSSLALETLGRLGEDIIYRPEKHEFKCKEGSWADRLSNDEQALVSNLPCWFAIRNLLRREYFTRLWVFQEIALASRATVFVGVDRLDWAVLALGLIWLQPRLPLLNQLIENLALEDFRRDTISDFMEITQDRNPHKLALASLLEKTTKLNCRDPRDRLYAIRGLTIPKHREYIVPDYSKSVEEVFKTFTIRLIKGTRDVQILARCYLHSTPPKFSMPTWVPDLSLTTLPERLFPLQASGRSRAVVVISDECLKLQGVQGATVTQKIRFVQPSDTDSTIIERCSSWEQICSPGAYMGGGSTIDAFLETILCGQIADLLPLENGETLSLRQCKRLMEGNNRTGGESSVATFAGHIRVRLRGRTIFKTREGFFGME